MVLEPWHDPKAVGRVWCLFEALTGMESGARHLEVCVSPGQHNDFRQTVFTNITGVLQLMSRLDLRNARATHMRAQTGPALAECGRDVFHQLYQCVPTAWSCPRPRS